MVPRRGLALFAQESVFIVFFRDAFSEGPQFRPQMSTIALVSCNSVGLKVVSVVLKSKSPFAGFLPFNSIFRLI